MAITVGITGGIGSGKSTVCKVFKMLGAPLFEADRVAKELINSNAKIKTGMVNLFGNDIYTHEGCIDRKKLATIIFNDDFQLAKVNALVHPAVRAEFVKWAEMQEAKYVIHEAAILFESGLYKLMDFTILVSAPVKQRIARVMKRDGTSEEQIKERMAKQWSDDKKRELATVEVKNNDETLLIPEIVKIDKQIKQYGKIW